MMNLYVDNQLSATTSTYSIANRNAAGTDGKGFPTLQAAVAIALAADTILIRAGTYNLTATITLSGKTKVGIAPYGTEVVTLTGPGTAIHGLTVVNCSYINLAGLVVSGFGGAGVLLRASSYCTVEGNELAHNGIGVQLVWRDTTKVASAYNRIVGNLIHHNTLAGENSDGVTCSTGTHHNIIHDNVVFANDDDGIDCSAGSGVVSAEGFDMYETITGNIVFDNGDSVGPGDGNGIKVSTNNGGGHLIAGNVCFDNERGGFDQDKEPGYPANRFYHNLAYNNVAGGFIMDAPALPANEDAILYNNIAVNNGIADLRRTDDAAVQQSDYNWWGDGKFVVGMDLHSQSGNPDFADPSAVINVDFPAGWTIQQKLDSIRQQVRAKFSLRPTSKAIDAGVVLTDLDRPFLGAVPDMGPYESEPAAVDPSKEIKELIRAEIKASRLAQIDRRMAELQAERDSL